MRSLAVVLASTLLATACIDSEVEDDADDAFTDADGKTDGVALTDAQIAGVLAFVNQASKSSLKSGPGLSDRVATNITTHRAGADRRLNTSDDDDFDTLKELDDVKYVGKTVLEALVRYAEDHGFVHDTPVGSGFCMTEHAGKTPGGVAVPVCDALYPAAPFLHVPADAASGSSVTVHGAILNGLGLHLHTSDGRALALVDSSGQTYSISHGPQGFVAPDNLFAIYAVTGTMTTANGEAALKVSRLVPEAWVPGAVQDKLLLGSWEAKAAKRVADRRFDADQPVPFRFTLKTTKENPTTWSSFGAGHGDGLIVSGAIDNFDKGVTAADGSCLPSLASLGASSPFYNATANRVALWRHPNMHGLNDQVIVMDYPTGSTDLSMNGMGSIEAFSVAALLSATGPNYDEVTIFPHATPTGHKVWGFAKVTAGGASCP